MHLIDGISLALQHLNESVRFFFFFNDTATTEIYTLSLHDALPISKKLFMAVGSNQVEVDFKLAGTTTNGVVKGLDRKSTRLNSSHDQISYAVFCLKKKKTNAMCLPISITPTQSNCHRTRQQLSFTL